MKIFLNLPSDPSSPQLLSFSRQLLTIPTTNAPQDANPHPGPSPSSKEPNQQPPRGSRSASRSTNNLQIPNRPPARSPAPDPHPQPLPPNRPPLLTFHPPPAPPTPLHPPPHHLPRHEGRRSRNLLRSAPLSSMRPAATHPRPSASPNTAPFTPGDEDELAGQEPQFTSRGVEAVADD